MDSSDLYTLSQVVYKFTLLRFEYLYTNLLDMTNTAKPPSKKRPKSTVVSCRTLDLEPLVQVWIDRNPGVKTSHLARLGLMLALKPFAGKRYAHLVKGAAL
jgi:hypothetical protein